METSLSNLVDILTEELHLVYCNSCDCFLEYKTAKYKLIKHKCLSCNQDYSKKIMKK